MSPLQQHSSQELRKTGAAKPRASRKTASALSSIAHMSSSNLLGTIVSASTCGCHTSQRYMNIHSYTLSQYQINSPQTLRQKYRTGSENIAQCPRAVGSSLNPADQVSNPLEKNAKSQPKTNERNRRLHDPH